MGEIGEESMKHMCRFCNKSFPCGRSLGGHMRSHVINSTDHDYQVKKKSCEGVLDKLCKECGKGFPSWKALFGHMKCHSLKNKKIASLNKDSWISPLDNRKSNARSGSIKRSRSRTSMVSEIEQEQEAEVAMSLMMLSRDKGSRSSKSSVSVKLRKAEGKDLIKNSYKMNKFNENEVGLEFLERSEVGLIKINDIDSDFGELKDSNKRNFECVTCDKSFHSHQALCGQKASHQKEPKRDFETKIQIDHEIKHEPVLVHDQTSNGYDSRSSIDHQETSSFNLDVGSMKKQKTVVLRTHECPICFKVFTSGQALGGHKRSHFNQENTTNMINKPDELVSEARGFLDLNMLPEEEEMNMSSSTTEFKSYCWEESSDHHSQQSRILCLLSTS